MDVLMGKDQDVLAQQIAGWQLHARGCSSQSCNLTTREMPLCWQEVYLSPFSSMTWLLAVACCACSSSKSHASSFLRLSLPMPYPQIPVMFVRWNDDRDSAYSGWVLNAMLGFHNGCQSRSAANSRTQREGVLQCCVRSCQRTKIPR